MYCAVLAGYGPWLIAALSWAVIVHRNLVSFFSLFNFLIQFSISFFDFVSSSYLMRSTKGIDFLHIIYPLTS